MIEQLRYQPVTPVQARSYKRLALASRVNDYLVIDAQNFAVPAWASAGASVVALNALITIPNQVNWTIKLPIAQIGSGFVPCIKWSVSGKVSRYSLWSSPVQPAVAQYNGEVIPYLAELELWTNGESQIYFPTWNLPTGLLRSPGLNSSTDGGAISSVGNAIPTYWCRPFDTPISTVDNIFLTCQLPSAL